MEESVKLRVPPLTGQQEQPLALINYLYIGHFLARWGTRFSFRLQLLISFSQKLDNGFKHYYQLK